MEYFCDPIQYSIPMSNWLSLLSDFWSEFNRHFSQCFGSSGSFFLLASFLLFLSFSGGKCLSVHRGFFLLFLYYKPLKRGDQFLVERTDYLHSGHSSLKLPGSYHIESLYMYHYKILLHIQYRPKIHSFSLRNIENDKLGDEPYFLQLHILFYHI